MICNPWSTNRNSSYSHGGWTVIIICYSVVWIEIDIMFLNHFTVSQHPSLYLYYEKNNKLEGSSGTSWAL